MLFWLLACKLAEDGGFAPADSPESAPPESAPPDSDPIAWPALSLDEAWESDEQDVATGLGVLDIDQDGDLDLLVANGNDIAGCPVALNWAVNGISSATRSDARST